MRQISLYKNNSLLDKAKVNPFLTGFFLLGISLALLGSNLLPSIVSLFTFYVVVKFFYKPGIPQVVLAAMLFQWLQINIKIWYGNIINVSFENVFALYIAPGKMHEAFYYSSFGLVALSLGIFYFFSTIDAKEYFKNLKNKLDEYNASNILYLYIIVTILFAILYKFRLAIPGINTIVVGISKLKWGFYLLLFTLTLIQRRFFLIFIIISLLEILFSLYGFFSSFKDFIFYILMGVISFTNYLSFKKFLISIPVFYLLFTLAVGWTAIKGEYRMFLSGGARSQAITASRGDAIDYFFELSSDMKYKEMDRATDALIDRISFIDFFSLAINHVPEYQQHEKGKIWWESISFFFMPRIFFHDKPVIDDSEHTSKYTGLLLADQSLGASHSIGFMADSYIDFGPVFMHVPIFFLGLVLGWMFKHFLLRSHNEVWGLIFAAPFYFLMSFYSFNLIKVIGNLLIYVVVIFILRKHIIKFIDPYIRK